MEWIGNLPRVGVKKKKHILKPPPSEWNELGIFPRVGVKKKEAYFETTT